MIVVFACATVAGVLYKSGFVTALAEMIGQ